MGYLTERLIETAFLPAGFPFSHLFSFCWPPEINSMKWDWIPRFLKRRLAPYAHNTNWDAEPRCGGSHARISPLDEQHDSRSVCVGDSPNWDFHNANW
jgi:hypothetical protein